MDDSGIPLGSMNRYLLLLLDDSDSALILVRQPVGNGGPEDSSANDSHIPRFQRCQQAPPSGELFSMLYSGYALLS